MSTIISSPKTNQLKRGLSVIAGRAMAATVKNFRNKMIGVIVAAVLAPQASFAGGHGNGGGGGHHSSGGSSMRSMPRTSGANKSVKSSPSKQTFQKNSSNTVKSNTFKRQSTDGTTGKGSNKNGGTLAGKQHGTTIRDMMKVDPVKTGGPVAATSAKAKFSKSELLAKYGVNNGGTFGMGSKGPSSSKNPSKSSNPSQNHSKHFDHWCNNNFFWLWGFYSPAVSYPGCPTIVSNPNVVYADAPPTVVDAQPSDAQVVAVQPAEAQPATFEPANAAPADATVSSQPVSPVPAEGTADLSVEEVRLVEAATASAGPAYRVTFRNVGAGAAGKFRIGAFAERENKLSDDSPESVTEVAGLAAGDASEVTLRLPVSAMRLVSSSSAQGVAFDQLLVIVDLDDVVVESEKSNNVVNLERAEVDSQTL